MIIRETEIAKKENTVVKIPVGELPSGNPIHISAHVYRSAKEGPCMLLIGGLHGDEINGVEIVRRAIQDKTFEQLQIGSVIAIPVLNVYGFINFSREVPDGKDVNRSFPGVRTGSLATRVAYTLHQDILPLADFGVDFHTGGRSNYNYPQIRYSTNDSHARELAGVFGAPITLAYKPIVKSLRKVAYDKHQLSMLVYEGGENLRYDGLSIQHGLAGIRRLLQHHAMLPGTYEPAESRHFTNTRWMRAPRGGLFQWLKPSGSYVKKGEPLGFISDPLATKPLQYLYATQDAFIFGHNNTPVVSQGEALFHLAY